MGMLLKVLFFGMSLVTGARLFAENCSLLTISAAWEMKSEVEQRAHRSSYIQSLKIGLDLTIYRNTQVTRAYREELKTLEQGLSAVRAKIKANSDDPKLVSLKKELTDQRSQINRGHLERSLKYERTKHWIYKKLVEMGEVQHRGTMEQAKSFADSFSEALRSGEELAR